MRGWLLREGRGWGGGGGGRGGKVYGGRVGGGVVVGWVEESGARSCMLTLGIGRAGGG